MVVAAVTFHVKYKEEEKMKDKQEEIERTKNAWFPLDVERGKKNERKRREKKRKSLIRGHND